LRWARGRQLETCRTLVDRCLGCAAAADLAGFLEADRDFHLTLLRSLGNQRLVMMVDRLRDQTRLYGPLGLARERLVASAEEHVALLDAIANRDVEAARTELKHHLEHTRGLWAGRPAATTRRRRRPRSSPEVRLPPTRRAARAAQSWTLDDGLRRAVVVALKRGAPRLLSAEARSRPAPVSGRDVGLASGCSGDGKRVPNCVAASLP
jgi:hypothetical protein